MTVHSLMSSQVGDMSALVGLFGIPTRYPTPDDLLQSPFLSGGSGAAGGGRVAVGAHPLE